MRIRKQPCSTCTARRPDSCRAPSASRLKVSITTSSHPGAAHPARVTVAQGSFQLACHGLPGADAPGRAALTTSAAIGAALGISLLNPHVYLDTVVLLGTLANQHADGRWLFGVGAATASLVWFVSLGFGARRLAGLFATPVTWRILDGLIAVTMVGLGLSLVVS